MSEPDRPTAAAPGNPTPEEISARLEALLKRTHALRAEQQAEAAQPMTWPPPERELDRLDVVGVPEHSTLTASAPAAAIPVSAPNSGADSVPSPIDAPAPSVFRHLEAEQPAPTPRRWLPVLTLLLALTTVGQAAYLFYLHQHGRLLPIEWAGGSGPAAAPTTVAETAAEPPTAPTAAAPTAGSGADTTTPTDDAPDAGVPEAAPTAPRTPTPAGLAGVSPTRGAVVIDSAPSGLLVVMEGRERGVTPITIGQLRPGRHDVLVGGRPYKVDIAAETVATLHVP